MDEISLMAEFAKIGGFGLQTRIEAVVVTKYMAAEMRTLMNMKKTIFYMVDFSF